MRCEAGDLIAHSLGGQNGDLIDDSLVCVEIERQFSVVLLDDSTSTLFNGLCTDTLLKNKEKHVSKKDEKNVVLSSRNHFTTSDAIDLSLRFKN